MSLIFIADEILRDLFNLNFLQFDETNQSLFLSLTDFRFEGDFIKNLNEETTALLIVSFEDDLLEIPYPRLLIFKDVDLPVEIRLFIAGKLLDATTFYHHFNALLKNFIFNVLNFTHMIIMFGRFSNWLFA